MSVGRRARSASRSAWSTCSARRPAPSGRARWGALRTTQAALLLAAAGLAGLTAGSAAVAVPASAALGIAYGLTNPAASQLLGRLAPPHRRNLVFALKQAGVPLGVALAGLALPSLAAAAGWRAALLAAAVLVGALALMVQPLRRGWDTDRDPTAPLLGQGGHGPSLLRAHPGLLPLALTGGAFALVQIALGAHMAAMLAADFGWDAVAAGALVALCQVTGALARLGWAMLADRAGSGLAVLAVIGASSVGMLALLPWAPGWGGFAVAALFVAVGATTAGWNGVLVAESVRLAPPGLAGAASGAVLSLTFLGAVLGPVGLALLTSALGSYVLAFALSAALPLAGATLSWTAHRRLARGA
ncbi:MAG: MFS transporter [Acetobacteraceae bacterium]|nr:MFS transporter [Acetobacteraceae bacterium]